MNFLAHLYLSGSSDPIRIGNFIGDFVKGNAYQKFPAEIQAGILFHREIDSYTDSHETGLVYRKKLSEYFGHYSGVVLDLYWDHFLAANWDSFHSMDLKSYTHQVYALLNRHQDVLPLRTRRMLSFMEEDNWLLSYASIDGIGQALTGLSRRTKFKSHMEKGEQVLRNDYESYKAGFLEFFPDLQQFAAEKNPAFSI